MTSIGPNGIELLVKLAVNNPNRFDLSARSVTGRVILDGKYDLGTVTVPHDFKVPSGQRTPLSVPLTLTWKDVAVLVALAAGTQGVPYKVDGSVNLGGDVLNVDLPFQLSGVIGHEELVRATVNSLPRFP